MMIYFKDEKEAKTWIYACVDSNKKLPIDNIHIREDFNKINWDTFLERDYQFQYINNQVYCNFSNHDELSIFPPFVKGKRIDNYENGSGNNEAYDIELINKWESEGFDQLPIKINSITNSNVYLGLPLTSLENFPAFFHGHLFLEQDSLKKWASYTIQFFGEITFRKGNIPEPDIFQLKSLCKTKVIINNLEIKKSKNKPVWLMLQEFYTDIPVSNKSTNLAVLSCIHDYIQQTKIDSLKKQALLHTFVEVSKNHHNHHYINDRNIKLETMFKSIIDLNLKKENFHIIYDDLSDNLKQSIVYLDAEANKAINISGGYMGEVNEIDIHMLISFFMTFEIPLNFKDIQSILKNILKNEVSSTLNVEIKNNLFKDELLFKKISRLLDLSNDFEDKNFLCSTILKNIKKNLSKCLVEFENLYNESVFDKAEINTFQEIDINISL